MPHVAIILNTVSVLLYVDDRCVTYSQCYHYLISKSVLVRFCICEAKIDFLLSLHVFLPFPVIYNIQTVS